jgi:DNA-binding NarL/FixJ family response regulator
MSELNHASIRVWIVEDDPQYRQVMSFIVRSTSGMGCPRTFEEGEELLEHLDRAPADEAPDVLLMDIHLPRMNGITCVAGVKARRPGIRVVMLTNLDDEKLIFDALRAGASGYLLKSAPIDQILSAIREAHHGGMLMPAPVAEKVLSFFCQTPGPPVDYSLTAREREVLEKMVEGLTQKEIAARLFISLSTVTTHIQHLYEKLHVNSNSAAVVKALRERLV